MERLPVMKSPARKLVVFFCLLLFGPSIGLVMAVFDLALAPSWTFMTNSLAPALSCLAVPAGLFYLIVQKMNPWLKTGLTFLLFLVPLVYMTLLPMAGGNITGMTNCTPAYSSGMKIRYNCVSSSSDDTEFRYEFTLQGWKGFPIMRVIEK